MATTKKTKVVDWRKELWKATGKYAMACVENGRPPVSMDDIYAGWALL